MDSLVQSSINKYNHIIHELADPRTQEWWGVSNPFFILTVVPAYLYFCQSLGPRLMKHRKPFELKNTLIVYNLFQVLMSLYLSYLGSLYIWNKEYSFKCDVIDYSTKPRALFGAGASWWYYMAKLTELLDTVFFVLRKKYNQVTFLHVYHHASMAFFVWFGVKYFPGGHLIFMGYLNSMVHVIMYSYYLLSGLGPEYQKYLWWKKHVTKIQLVYLFDFAVTVVAAVLNQMNTNEIRKLQFVMIFVHNFMVFFYECGYPRLLNFLSCISAICFIYMFGSFYIKSYKAESKEQLNVKAKNSHKVTKNVNYSEKSENKEKYR